MTADDLEECALRIQGLEFEYVVSSLKRERHRRKAWEIERRSMDDRTVAELSELAHHKREARQHERAMSDAIRAAHAIESRVFLEDGVIEDE